MKRKLLEELPGILNWALAGAKDCLVSGLNPPREVIETRDEYRRDEDRLRSFLENTRPGASGKARRSWAGTNSRPN
jgi:putative DNA primase/helicase